MPCIVKRLRRSFLYFFSRAVAVNAEYLVLAHIADELTVSVYALIVELGIYHVEKLPPLLLDLAIDERAVFEVGLENDSAQKQRKLLCHAVAVKRIAVVEPRGGDSQHLVVARLADVHVELSAVKRAELFAERGKVGVSRC